MTLVPGMSENVTLLHSEATMIALCVCRNVLAYCQDAISLAGIFS
jgi:hypothetical protein